MKTKVHDVLKIAHILGPTNPERSKNGPKATNACTSFQFLDLKSPKFQIYSIECVRYGPIKMSCNFPDTSRWNVGQIKKKVRAGQLWDIAYLLSKKA